MPTTSFEQHPAAFIPSLLPEAFAPSHLCLIRSEEYNADVEAPLLLRLAERPISCPHLLVTAAADASFAGNDEGNRIWAEYVRKHPLAGTTVEQVPA